MAIHRHTDTRKTVAWPDNCGVAVTRADRPAVTWPVTGTAAVTWPVTGTAVTWPVTGTAVTWPVTVTAVTWPATRPAVTWPVTGTAVTWPVTGTAVTWPVTVTAVTWPATRPAVTWPVTGTAVTWSVTGTAVTWPVTGTEVTWHITRTAVTWPVTGAAVTWPDSKDQQTVTRPAAVERPGPALLEGERLSRSHRAQCTAPAAPAQVSALPTYVYLIHQRTRRRSLVGQWPQGSDAVLTVHGSAMSSASPAMQTAAWICSVSGGWGKVGGRRVIQDLIFQGTAF